MLDKSDALSTELWALVFLHLSSNQWRPQCEGLSRRELRKYSNLHRLKLVCKKFKDVFQEHHNLFSLLVLRENLGAQALPGLLAWVLRHDTDISLLHSLSGGPCTDAALACLMGKQQLTTAYLKSPSDSAVHLLSMCTLTVCTLHKPLQNLDLDCLKSIHTLKDLELSAGTFTHVRLTSHLTAVDFSRAHVGVDAVDADCGLKQLYMDRSDIHGLEGGICMLTSLFWLWCFHSVVHTSQAACKLSTAAQYQVDLHGLTALTQLELLELSTKRPAYPSLEPVYALQSLVDLSLIAAGSSIDVTEGLSKLSRLTRLAVQPVLGPSTDEAAEALLQLKLQVQWDRMRNLQILLVSGANLKLHTNDLVKLTELKDLREVDFSGSLPADALSATYFARLVHHLGLKRPDIQFQMSVEGEL